MDLYIEHLKNLKQEYKKYSEKLGYNPFDISYKSTLADRIINIQDDIIKKLLEKNCVNNSVIKLNPVTFHIIRNNHCINCIRYQGENHDYANDRCKRCIDIINPYIEMGRE